MNFSKREQDQLVLHVVLKIIFTIFRRPLLNIVKTKDRISNKPITKTPLTSSIKLYSQGVFQKFRQHQILAKKNTFIKKDTFFFFFFANTPPIESLSQVFRIKIKLCIIFAKGAAFDSRTQYRSRICPDSITLINELSFDCVLLTVCVSLTAPNKKYFVIKLFLQQLANYLIQELYIPLPLFYK